MFYCKNGDGNVMDSHVCSKNTPWPYTQVCHEKQNTRRKYRASSWYNFNIRKSKETKVQWKQFFSFSQANLILHWIKPNLQHISAAVWSATNCFIISSPSWVDFWYTLSAQHTGVIFSRQLYVFVGLFYGGLYGGYCWGFFFKHLYCIESSVWLGNRLQSVWNLDHIFAENF